jgi:Lrp/AsnC family transcriptional regulator, leucine-responsive regulatory protein
MAKFSHPDSAADLRKRKRDDLPAPLDAIDRRILRILQDDSLVTNQPLADRIGLSLPACLKRVSALRSRGIIAGTVAILDPEALGYPVLVMVRVRLDRPRESALGAFERRMRELPSVVQRFTVAGEIDHVILVRSRSIADYHEFARRVLGGSGIRSYTSNIVLAVAKWTTAVPIEEA